VDPEGLVGIKRRAGGLGILRDEFQVRESRQRGHHKGQQERQPHDAAHCSGHGPRDGVNPCTQDVTDDEEQEELRAKDPLESGFLPFGGNVIHFFGSCAHGRPPQRVRRLCHGMHTGLFTLYPRPGFGNESPAVPALRRGFLPAAAFRKRHPLQVMGRYHLYPCRTCASLGSQWGDVVVP
jgi:hypothetical protein